MFIRSRFEMLAIVNFNDDFLFKADEIQNVILKRYLAPKLSPKKLTIAQQSPHCALCIGRITTHMLCETAISPRDRPMVKSSRH